MPLSWEELCAGPPGRRLRPAQGHAARGLAQGRSLGRVQSRAPDRAVDLNQRRCRQPPCRATSSSSARATSVAARWQRRCCGSIAGTASTRQGSRRWKASDRCHRRNARCSPMASVPATMSHASSVSRIWTCRTRAGDGEAAGDRTACTLAVTPRPVQVLTHWSGAVISPTHTVDRSRSSMAYEQIDAAYRRGVHVCDRDTA